MRKLSVFMRLVLGAGLFFGTCGLSGAQNTLTAETKMFLAEWRPLQQKSLTMLRADETFKTLQENYGLRVVADAQTKSEQLMLPVWVTFRSEEAAASALQDAEALGFQVQTRLKTVCTGLIPVNRIEALGAVEGVRQVQAGQRAEIRTDIIRKVTHVDTLQDDNALNIPEIPSLRGEGVIIGVVDGGIEYVHPNFYDPDDAEVLRIKRVWSQREKTGVRPEGYRYGVEYATQEDIEEAGYSKDNETHGTHVTGIAAGTGAGTGYKGMAPKADLVVVPTTLVTEDILDGVKYIRDYAAGVGKPCVVNLSIGFHIGPHDGTSAFDRALDEMKAPGFIVVGAASNDGNTPLYGHYDFKTAEDTVFYTALRMASSSVRNNTVDIWSNDSTAFSVGMYLVDPATGETFDFSGFCSARGTESMKMELHYDESNTVSVVFNPEYNEINGKFRMMVRTDIRQMDRPASDYILCLAMRNDEPASPSGIQMWATNGRFEAFAHDGLKPAVDGATHHTVGEIGGTSNSILSVGSYTTRNHWTGISGKEMSYRVLLPEDTLSYFSSHGPTADGRVKPDIAAPGAFIVSSFNSHYIFSKDDQVEMVSKDGRTYPFCTMMGTSMASPAVTGITALCLQVRPDWQVDSVRYYLSHTALNDRYTGALRANPDNDWGYGKIDALALLTAALKGVTEVSAEEVREAVEGKRLLAYPNPSDGHFSVLLPDLGREVRLQVVDRAGRVVYEQAAIASGSPVEMAVPGLKQGLYVLRVADADGTRPAGVVADSLVTKLIIR